MRLRDLIAVASGGALLAVAGGCSLSDRSADKVAGKQMFVEKCGACHTLARAGTKGTQGPNLDQAFAHGLASGMERSGIEGAVHEQILNPAKLAKDSPNYMPPKLVTGDDARDVAAYVASVVAAGGKDTGLLAEAGKPKNGKPAAEKGGVISIEATGTTAYVTNAATGQPGAVTIRSPNPSGTPHNIALEGPGVSGAVGKVVSNGGVSEVKATLKKGEYTFYCSVDGHRAAGMEGKLVVK